MIQNKFIVILIVILGFAGGYFYYTNNPIETIPPMVGAADDLSAFASMSLDFSIFNSEKYKSLELFGESPVKSGPTSKDDPFAP